MCIRIKKKDKERESSASSADAKKKRDFFFGCKKNTFCDALRPSQTSRTLPMRMVNNLAELGAIITLGKSTGAP